MKAEVIEITPAMAARMLARSKPHGQRPLEQRRLNRYARDMNAGRWLLTGEPITECTNGSGEKQVLNGFHRLTACKISGKSFKTMFITEVDPETFVVMDTGKPRGLADVLRFNGHQSVNALAAAITTASRYDRGALLKSELLTRQESLDWFEENEAIIESVRVTPRHRKYLAMPPTPLTVSHYLTERLFPGDGEDFWEQVASGASLEEGSVLLVFRRWLDTWTNKRDKPAPIVFLANALKAMNAHRSGRDLKIMRWTRQEGIPPIWGES